MWYLQSQVNQYGALYYSLDSLKYVLSKYTRIILVYIRVYYI